MRTHYTPSGHFLGLPQNPVPHQRRQWAAGAGDHDKVRYHHARLYRDWREQQADRFALDYLPPYSPSSTPSHASVNSLVNYAYATTTSQPSGEITFSAENQFANWSRGKASASYAQLLKTASCLDALRPAVREAAGEPSGVERASVAQASHGEQ